MKAIRRAKDLLRPTVLRRFTSATKTVLRQSVLILGILLTALAGTFFSQSWVSASAEHQHVSWHPMWVPQVQQDVSVKNIGGQVYSQQNSQSDTTQTTTRGKVKRSPKIEETFQRLISKAELQGTARVIVGVNVAFTPEGFLPTTRHVKRQRDSIARAQEGVLSRLSQHSVRSVKKFDFIPYVALEVDAEGLRRLREDPGVSTIHEDELLRPLLAESVPLIGAPQAWASGYTGRGQAVAILDSGVDKDHPFLANKVISEACYSTSWANHSTSLCPNAASESTEPGSGINCDPSIENCKHGTHVAGIAAGTNSDFSGVAKGASLISIQVFSLFNNQADCGDSPAPCLRDSTSDLIRGLNRVAELSSTYKIAAVNISLGGGRFNSQDVCDDAEAPTKAAIDNLSSLGIATVIASGNNSYPDSLSSPACISSAISVGSTDDGSDGTTADVVSTFSNSACFLKLLAPGQWINSSIPGGGFSNLSGTSMAAPHVAGAWAILKSKEPSASVADVLAALANTGMSVTDPRNNLPKPRIKVDAALNALGAPNLPPNIPSSLSQSKIYADAGLAEGGTTTEPAVRFRASISDPNGYPVKLQIELRLASEPFTGIPTLESGLAQTTDVTLTQLGLDFGDYKWACRAVDAGGLASPWVEFGVPGNTDFSRVRITNDYVRIDQVYRRMEGGTPYIYVRWTLLRKWNDAEVAVYPSLNDNLPSINLSSFFEPLLMGNNFVGYLGGFHSLGMNPDQGYYMWKPVGSPCNDNRQGPGDYQVGAQYTTRFQSVFDMSTFSWVDASSVADTANIRFTVYDRTQPDASPCNMDFKEAFPDSTNYNLTEPPGLNHPPNDPTAVSQSRIYADAGLPEGGNTTESAVRFKAVVSDPDGDPVKLQVELRQLSEPFTGTPTAESGLTNSGAYVTVTQTGIAFGDYKWAYRAVDANGLSGPWVEFGVPGNRDFSRVQIPNDYVRIDSLYKQEDAGTKYIYVRWTLLRKWNDAEVAVYPSLKNNLPSLTLSSSFEPLFMGGNFVSYSNGFRSLGLNLDQGYYMWKPVGGMCNNAGPGPGDYQVGAQYTTRFQSIFDMSTFSWVNASDVAPTADLRFTVYDRTQFNASPCNMDFKEAFPDSTNYHLVPIVSPGQVIINEFRLRGPAGQTDEFIELYNATDQDIVVADANPVTCALQTLLAPPPTQCGWSVVDLQGAVTNTPRFVVPAGTLIPARGHYLAAGTGYSLSAVAVPDQTYDPPLYDGGEADYTGLALYRTADRTQFSSEHLLDAVGFDGVTLPYREGSGLLPASGIASDVEHSFLRNQSGGLPADTGNNRSDFVLVAPDPNLITGANAVLGAPGPENLTSPIQHNSQFLVTVPPGVSSSVRTSSPPVTNGSLGTLSLRRRFINNTGRQVTKLRFRVTDLTTINSPTIYASQADVRVLNATLSALSGTTLKAATLDPTPSQSKGGGVNASLVVSGSLTLAQPLQAGQSVDVEFLLGVMRGGSYRFIISVEALP